MTKKMADPDGDGKTPTIALMTSGADRPEGQPAAKTLEFDPAHYRLPQDFEAECGIQRQLTRVPVRRPNKQDFVRVHPSPSYRLEAALLELKDEGEMYLVAPELRPALIDELLPARLYTAINRQGVVFLWPIRLPGADGRANSWHESGHRAAAFAVDGWVRVIPNRSLGGYDVHRATSDRLGDPAWPAVDFPTLLKIAFQTMHIGDLDHAVVRRLRGLT